MKNLKRNVDGITLIALVVTIIVLLILAGVSITMLTGENGILKMATKAADEYKKAAEEEQNLLNSYITLADYIERKEKAEIWTGSVAESFEKGEGTEESPYEIRNGEELALLAKKVNVGEQQEGKVYTIVNDINLNNIAWTPIGGNQPLPNKDATIDITEVKEQFKGKIKGNNKIIFNLKIELINSAGVGLIGILGEGGTIEGIIIDGGDIKGGQEVGGIAGITRGTITSCENNAAVTGVDDASISGTGQYIGGIVGSGYGTIENCTNRGDILGANKCVQRGRAKCVGGIIGATINDTSIIGCINEGNITTQYMDVGGIIGDISQSEGGKVEVKDCINRGNVTAKNPYGTLPDTTECNAGGIIGYMGTGAVTVTGCNNKGRVQANGLYRAGGIIGVMVDGTITKCSNEAMVIGNGQQVGGILGKMQAGTVEECSNTGTIIGNAQGARGFTGGIAGWVLGGTVNKTYNIGKIQSGYYIEDTIDAAGGIVGALQDTGIVTNNYSDCEIEGGDVQGGIVGQFINDSTASISNCYYTTSNENINGIGSKSPDKAAKVEQADKEGITERIEKIESYEEFIKWIDSK